MHGLTDNHPHTHSPFNSATTERRRGNERVEPALTSGFGAVIEKERDLQAVTEGSLGQVNGQHSRDLVRILRHQHSRLGANLALLEQRYESLPHPERFASWNGRHHPTNTVSGLEGRDESRVLPDLIARHAGLQMDVEALIECAPDGQRGELILREVCSNHEEMAWMLTALLNEDATSARIAIDEGNRAPTSTSQAEESWDNEGGPVGSVAPRSALSQPLGGSGR